MVAGFPFFFVFPLFRLSSDFSLRLFSAAWLWLKAFGKFLFGEEGPRRQKTKGGRGLLAADPGLWAVFFLGRAKGWRGGQLSIIKLPYAAERPYVKIKT
jgi:hypothetical protein